MFPFASTLKFSLPSPDNVNEIVPPSGSIAVLSKITDCKSMFSAKESATKLDVNSMGSSILVTSKSISISETSAFSDSMVTVNESLVWVS